MLRKGQTIRNERTGESLTMIVSEFEGAGERQLYRVHLPPHRESPPLHYHVDFTETFSVIEGKLTMYLGNERRKMVLIPGQSVRVERKQLHTFENDTDQPCDMQVETCPAGGVVAAFQVAYAIANTGGSARDGLPANPILRLRFVQISQGFLPRVPRALQQTVFAIAFLISKVTGHERTIERIVS